MNAEITRLKQDLKTIEEAVGCEPEFNRCQVWKCIGFGITGLVMMLQGVFWHEVPRYWGFGMIMVLSFGLPYLLPRIFCPTTPRVASTADKDMNSWGLSCLVWVFVFGFFFWLRILAVPPMAVGGLLCVVPAALVAVWAWRRPWRRFKLGWELAWALALMELGIVLPFFPHDPRRILLMFGYAYAVGSFAGAIILHLQLKAHDTNGKAAD